MTPGSGAAAWAHAVVSAAPGSSASTVVTGLGVPTQSQTPAPPPGDPTGGRGEEFGKTSPLALVVILLLGLATVLLIRSMNKRLRNVPASFDDPGPTEPDAPDQADPGVPPNGPVEGSEKRSTTDPVDGPPRAGSP